MPLARSMRAATSASMSALLGEVGIAPAGEQVAPVPLALAVPHEHERVAGVGRSATHGTDFHVSEPQHVGHRIKARRLAAGPTAAAFTAPRANMDRIAGDVRKLDALARAGKNHRVLADDAAAAQRRKADVAALARAGDAVARPDGALLQDRCRGLRRRRRPASARCRTAHRPCRGGASRRSRCRSPRRAPRRRAASAPPAG